MVPKSFLFFIFGALIFTGGSPSQALDSQQTSQTPPNPLAARERTILLDGAWQFQRDHQTIDRSSRQKEGVNIGISNKWYLPEKNFSEVITVPYPYETEASGVAADNDSNKLSTVVWYKRAFATPADFSSDQSLILHFGAVDYKAAIWINGRLVGTHVGGHTHFSFDLSKYINPPGQGNTLVVRAYDDVTSETQRLGKQDTKNHDIIYEGSTGIWKPVWIEITGKHHIEDDFYHAWVINDVSDIHDDGTATGNLEIEGSLSLPSDGYRVKVTIFETNRQGRLKGDPIASQIFTVRGRNFKGSIHLENAKLWYPRNSFHQERWWQPNVYKLVYEVVNENGQIIDERFSQAGLKTLENRDGRYFINNEEVFYRGILDQLYEPDTHLAASESVIKNQIRKILGWGFNFVRLHQSVPDPRFLYWASRMGLMCSVEVPSPRKITPQSEKVALAEVREIVEEGRNSAALVRVVDNNEGWGIGFHGDVDRRHQRGLQENPLATQKERAFYLAYLEKSGDLIRSLVKPGIVGRSAIADEHGNSVGIQIPAVDGWWSTGDKGKSNVDFVHSYPATGTEFVTRYQGLPRHVLRGSQLPIPDARKVAPGDEESLNRQLIAGSGATGGPVDATEFGGVGYWPQDRAIPENVWGYEGMTRTPEEFARRLHSLFSGLQKLNFAGATYTQLKNTGYEVNGLLTEDGVPKLPAWLIRQIVTLAGDHNLARAAKVEHNINNYFREQERLKNLRAHKDTPHCMDELQLIMSKP